MGYVKAYAIFVSKITFVIIFFVCGLGFFEKAFAQTNEPFTKQCFSQTCSSVYNQIQAGQYETSKTTPGTWTEKSECSDDNDLIGHEIARVTHMIDTLDEEYGGNMPHDKANRIRSLVFNETYEIRNKIQELTYYGDVVQCHRVRSAAISIIQSIINEK